MTGHITFWFLAAAPFVLVGALLYCAYQYWRLMEIPTNYDLEDDPTDREMQIATTCAALAAIVVCM